jgi:WD40 repeat protein
VGLVKSGKAGGPATWLSGNRVRLLDPTSGKKLRELVVPSSATRDGRPAGPGFLAFTPDGKALVTGGGDRAVRLWDADTGRELRSFTDLREPPSALALAPGGKAFAVAEAGRAVRVRDLATGLDLVPLAGHRASLWRVALSADGLLAATAGKDRVIHLWDLQKGQNPRTLAGHDNWVARLAFAPDGRRLYSAGYDKTLRLWDLAKGEEVRRLGGERAAHGALAPDGKTVAWAGRPKSVLLLEAATAGKVRALADAAERTVAAAFTPDGRTLLAWGDDRNLHAWDVATGRHRARPCDGLREHTKAVAFSPDGRLVAFGGQEAYLVLADVETGLEVRRLAARSATDLDTVWCLAFAPDGRTLAWAGPRDGVIRLCEVATGQERHRLTGHQGGVFSLAFAPGGRVLLSGAEDTTALVWDLVGPPAPLAEGALAGCWEDLGSEDAVRAYAALRRLVADPGRAVPLIDRRLRPVPGVEGRRVAALVADLDSETFAVRERAAAELGRLGDAAAGALRAALAGEPSPEARRQLQTLLARLEDWTPARLRSLRAVEALEHIGSPEAGRVLGGLAKGAPGARQTDEARESLRRLEARGPRKPSTPER